VKLTTHSLNILGDHIAELFKKHHGGAQVPLSALPNIYHVAELAAARHFIHHKTIREVLAAADPDILAAMADAVRRATEAK